MNWGQIFPTLLCYQFELRTNLESYTFRKWWKIEQFRFILIIVEVHATGNTAQLDFRGEIWIESCPPNTLMLSVRPGNHFEMIYTLRRWLEFERFRSILIIFEVHATDNTAQLGFCGSYRLRWVPPTPIYWFDLTPTAAQLSSIARRIDFKSDQNNRHFFNFHHFLGEYDPKVPSKSNQWAQSARETEINLFSWKTCIGCYIPLYLAPITNGVLTSLSGTMKLTSGSSQRYKRGQKSPLDPTVLAGPLQSGYRLVHSSLQTSKMAKMST